MNDDIRLQELFDGYKPSLPDGDRFVSRLERKLALIDEIKQAQTAQNRRYQRAVVAAFVVGIIVGVSLLFFTLTTPVNAPLFTLGVNSYPLVLIEHNSRLIGFLFASLMIAFCIIALMNTGELIARARMKIKDI